MIKITFPDGNVKEFAKGTTAYQIAESISPRLAADSLAASVNGATVDLNRAIEEDASIKFYKWDDPEGKHAFWHTSSHLLAEALEALYPGIKFGIGPSIENGFYYDVDSPVPITEADLPKIEKKMEELARSKETQTDTRIKIQVAHRQGLLKDIPKSLLRVLQEKIGIEGEFTFRKTLGDAQLEFNVGVSRRRLVADRDTANKIIVLE